MSHENYVTKRLDSFTIGTEILSAGPRTKKFAIQGMIGQEGLTGSRHHTRCSDRQRGDEKEGWGQGTQAQVLSER